MTLVCCKSEDCKSTIEVRGAAREGDLKRAGWKVLVGGHRAVVALCPGCWKGEPASKNSRLVQLLASARKTGRVIPDSVSVWRLPDKVKECAWKPCCLCGGRTRRPIWLSNLNPYDFKSGKYNHVESLGCVCENCSNKLGVTGMTRPIEGDDCPYRFKEGHLMSGPVLR